MQLSISIIAFYIDRMLSLFMSDCAIPGGMELETYFR